MNTVRSICRTVLPITAGLAVISVLVWVGWRESQSWNRVEPNEVALPSENAPSVLAEDGAPPASPALAGENRDDASGDLDLAPAALRAEELASAQRLLEKYPSDLRALNVLAHVYNNHGKRGEAVLQWRKLIALDPDNATAYDAMAKVAFLKGDHEEAVRLWRKTLEVSPNRPGVHYQLGTALMGTGRLEEAAAAFNRETQLNPKASGPRAMLGEICRLLERHDQALDHFESAVHIDPNHLKACYGMAMSLRALNDTEASQRWMARFRELKSRQVRADHDRRGAYDDLGEIRRVTARTLTELAGIYAERRDFDSAEKLWLRASALDRTQLSCRQNLGQLYHYTRRLDKAIEMCRELAELEPDNADYLVNMAVFHSQLEQFDAAVAAMEKANGVDPERPANYRFLAKIYLQTSRDVEQAVAYARRALELEPSAANYFILGKALEHQGDLAAALNAYQHAVRLNPFDSDYESTYRQCLERHESKTEK